MAVMRYFCLWYEVCEGGRVRHETCSSVVYTADNVYFIFHFQHKMFVTINQQHQLAQHQQLVKLLEMRCISGGLTHCTLPFRRYTYI